MRYRNWICLVIIGSLTAIHCAPRKSLRAGEIIERIKRQSGVEWKSETVDTYKGGNEEIAITGIATTFLATMDVLKRAKSKGLNLVLTHEPTFYNHLDSVNVYGENDPVITRKIKYIRDNNLVVFRFHDHIHAMKEDGIYKGVISDLHWEEYQVSSRPYIFTIPETTVGELAKEMEEFYKVNTVRVIGNPDLLISNVSLVLGAPGPGTQISTLRREDVEVIIGGEGQEWEGIEYVRDANSLGMKKAMILVGHANSEEAGMKYCAEWLKTFIPELPIEHLAAGDPFWSP